MRDSYLLITIMQREFVEDYDAFFRRQGVVRAFETLCHGTAQNVMLECLGLEKTDKLMLISLLPGQMRDRVLKGLVNELGINVPGSGIALTIPVDSVEKSSSEAYFLGDQDTKEVEGDGGDIMKETQYALIIAVAERGSSDIVMKAARKANAAGGTVVHAKGLGTSDTAKFMGISIADEKELVYIVTKRQEKENIMQAIVEHAGMNTKAHAVCFSLPVDDVVGLRAVMEE